MSDIVKTGLGIAEVIGDKRGEILRLAATRKAYNVRIFGSVARGEAHAGSDVDFLVQFRGDASLWDKIGLWQDLTELIGRNVDLSTDKTLLDHVRPAALKDAVNL